MRTILPLLRWPGPAAAAAVVVCAVSAQAEGDLPAAPAEGAAPAPARHPAAGPGRPRRAGKPRVEGVLNLNRASEAELRLLPGIGKGRAHAIVERRKQGEFRSIEDVARIKGLRRLVARLKKHLAVVGASTLRPLPDTTTSAGKARAREPRGPG